MKKLWLNIALQALMYTFYADIYPNRLVKMI